MEKNIDWEELVDLYVDGECTSEERLTLEEQAAYNSVICAALDSALRIRKGLQELRVEIPKGFGKRLQQALADAQTTGASRAPECQERSQSVRRAFLNPRIVATVAALVAVVFGTVAIVSNQKGSEADVPQPERRIAGEATVKIGLEANEYIRIPSSIGTNPESVAKRDSQDAFWAIVTVNESQQLKKQSGRFQRLCNKLDVRFTKSGNDCEYLLKEAGTQEWKQIAGELAAMGEVAESDALRSWRSQETSEARDVRVVFKTAAPDVSAGMGETVEE